jgi:uncharacterized membrane protein YgdD (TMEM256/DUF423 family)
MRWIVIAAAILGASSVVIGAMLRHMAGHMDAEILQTALRYHQLHSVVLLALGLYALDKARSFRIIVPAVLFIAGVILFSGSIYLSEAILWPVLTMLTPLGGISLILAWLSLIFVKNGAVYRI